MSEKILVTYATKYGSTAGVAEAIANTIREKGNSCDLFPTKEVKSVAGYDAVVIGSPLYIGNILGDVSKFMTRNKDMLTKLPSAFFVLGPLENTRKEIDEVRKQLDTVLEKNQWYQPIATDVFVGVYNPAKLRFPDSLINIIPASPLKGRPATDNRDWAAIQEWALSLPDKLGISA